MSGRRALVAGGCQLEHRWLGPGPEAAPTLVFLHDGLGCAATWRDFPAALAEATGCGALVYSRAGYGGSEALPGPWPVRFMHDEALITLPQVLAELEVRDGFLIGHSDGASISLIYAAGPPDPTRDGEPGGGSGAAAPGATGRAWLRGMVIEAAHVFVEPISLESIARVPGIYRQRELAERMARFHGANAPGCLENWVEVWLRHDFRSWNILEELPRVRCPVLAMQGEQDAYGTLAQLRAVEAGCGGPVEALVVAHCGHTPHRQQREATLAAMTRFVRRLL